MTITIGFDGFLDRIVRVVMSKEQSGTSIYFSSNDNILYMREKTMKPFDSNFTKIETFIKLDRQPDFDNLLKVLERKEPSRPTLFEYFMCDEIYDALTRHLDYDSSDELKASKKLIDAFRIAGYDYATILGSDFNFPCNRHNVDGSKTISINKGYVITDRESFENYDWPDPKNFDYSRLEKLENYLYKGMKLLVTDNDGLLESVIRLVGYDNLCFMMIEDPELVSDIFFEVGSRLTKYFEICSGYSSVGGCISGDDWGFNSQTMFSPKDLRKYLFPWHKKIAEIVHSAGKKAILHSCGNLTNVFDDIIDDIKYDGKHSYEDKILPIEKAYEQLGSRISLLGGMDLDFICRSSPEEVYSRAAAMLAKSASGGGYALGSGNSIPNYVPQENYLAMIAAAVMNEWKP